MKKYYVWFEAVKVDAESAEEAIAKARIHLLKFGDVMETEDVVEEGPDAGRTPCG